ncbi:CDP-diacylglycerol--serine O-phosphatidyltransferase [Phycicoccus sp. CSK15P-2]|uniref:CDP-diacylglycerol--serine O-phosphatidyltransferase n=1 Tax=Phycicoccus sp. CSK15P-2 TaxID=2807627 RepID=UPI001950ACFB|nr:CDP-diacylglycerol--serine O-phosphatidyltransferase [Phycicoccus sp. CSK15P-2]MBM6403847.1 CDP-diacylglycerol--serine O-phosphatidyltransferase [Phycicoccus sp. CSK15P-2]
MSSGEPATGRRRILDRWRLVSPTGARVVSLRQLRKRERARLLAPSAFTTLNLVSGFSSVLLAFRGHFTLAAVLIAFSIVMDIADGFVARLVGATSPFGLQLDSLADLISFGVAPAVLVHTWALDDWPYLAWLVAFLWLSCAAFRLARFNVTIDPAADKRYFVGLPSPGAASVVIATIFALDSPHFGPGTGPWLAWFPLIVSVGPALLMVMTIRFRSFRNLLSPRTRRARLGTAAVALAIVVGLAVAPGLTGLVVAYGYVLTAPLGVLSAPLRERWLGPDAVAPPRHRMPSVFLPFDEDDDIDGPAVENDACGPEPDTPAG